MARRHSAEQRMVLPDAKYGHVVLAKFINVLMCRGKKAVAERVVYSALDEFADKVNVTAVAGFEKVISNVRPLVEVRSRRVGGATYQVPMEVEPRRGVALAMRWLLKAARTKSGKSMSEKLWMTFLDAYNGVGAAVKKRDDTHKMAEANRAFAHYKW